MPRGNQLTRQWHLLQLLDRSAGVAVDDAARDLDCAVRTIWRDLRVLQDTGFPIYDELGADGHRSVWRVDDTFDKPETFDVEKYLEGAWGITRGDIVTVKVVFARSLARYIRDRLWHPTQKFRDVDGGRLEMTLRVADTLEARRWILGFGSEAEVLEPAALREALRQDAEALAKRLMPRRVPPASISLPVSGGPLRHGATPRV